MTVGRAVKNPVRGRGGRCLPGGVRIERFDAAADVAAVRAVYDVYRAGAPVDFPGSPPMSFGVFGGLMVQGWCGEPRENWLACREPGGAVAGAYTLELPDRENRDRAGLSVRWPRVSGAPGSVPPCSGTPPPGPGRSAGSG